MGFKDIFVYPRYPDNLKKLYALAQNTWCTNNFDGINLFYRIDARLFRSVNHNPVRFLLTLPRERVAELSKDEALVYEVNRVWAKFEDYMKFQPASKTGPGGVVEWRTDDVVAYFSMEFGLHESLPTYSGGLGVLAGDFLKTASDMALPVIGVGLIYKYGYFTQRINLQGRQEEMFVEIENHLLPIKEMRLADGKPAIVETKILKKSCKIKLWQVDVGRTKLILLDTDIDDNPSPLKDITNELYVADKDKRIQQEIVLGFGGIKALDLLGIRPRVYHINEGHSAFLLIARMQKLMTANKLAFSEARAMVQASTVFTTHTPVVAGNENFETKLVQKYLEPEIETLGWTFEEFAPQAFLGENKDVFWLPALAIRYSGHINAVSKIHCDVSRKMWSGLYPQTPLPEVPIDYVTNGVHWSWISEPFMKLYDRFVGPDYTYTAGDPAKWKKIADVPDEEIWEAHHANKHSLIAYIRRKLADDFAARGNTQIKIDNLSRLFNPEYLTVVFARRFAHYKRATLLLKDRDRLLKILNNPRKPVQLIFAGKAHPADTSGKYMIKEIVDFAKEYHLEDRVVFLENYDMDVARHLLWGADVWLNTPIMENEASGTSGMKAGMNGVLNLSIPDGWWPECYNGDNGWSVTAGEFYKQSPLMEIAEAEQIYDLLEEEVSELFYERNEAGIPKQWVRMMKESIITVCGQFNMNRVLAEYLNKFYRPSVNNYDRLAADNFRRLKDASKHEQEILKCWNQLAFTDFTTSLDKMERVAEGDMLQVRAAVNLGRASTELFAVELFYMFDNRKNYKVVPMRITRRDGNIAYYECSFAIEGYGLQNINVRLKPADPTIQALHPELIKWRN
ncbi:MAG: alpha-glucan family phosphorylase [Sedimentisphaerales bacterium]